MTGLAGSDDITVYETAVEHQRVVVTENFAVFAMITTDRHAAGEPSVAVVFVRKQPAPAWLSRWPLPWHVTCTSGPPRTRSHTRGSTGPESSPPCSTYVSYCDGIGWATPPPRRR